MLDVENLPAELLLLAGTRLCMGRTRTVAGGATFFGIHFLRNNAGTGVVATLLAIIVGFDVATRYNIGPSLNSGTPGGSRAYTDGRVFGEGTALVTMQDNNSLVSGSTFATLRTTAEGHRFFEIPKAIAVITPGTSFSVSNGVADEGLEVSWFWQERQAQPSELNL